MLPGQLVPVAEDRFVGTDGPSKEGTQAFYGFRLHFLTFIGINDCYSSNVGAEFHIFYRPLQGTITVSPILIK